MAHEIFPMLLILATTAWSSLVSVPVPPSTQGNYLQDRNHDGRLDAIQLEFVSNLTQEYLDQILDSVVLTWPDTSGRMLRLVSYGTDFTLDTIRPRRISHTYPSHWPIATGLTQLGSLRYPFSYGDAAYYAAGNPEPFPIRITEALAPIITEARLYPGTSADPDTLHITLSEPVQSLSKAHEDLFEFRTPAASLATPLHASHVQWMDLNRLVLLVAENAGIHLRDGDSLRLLPASVQDFSGNQPSPGQRYQAIQGQFPFDLQVLSKATYTGKSWLERPLYQVEFHPFGDSLPEQDWLGVGMDIGSPALVSTIRSRLRDKQDIDPARIEWYMEIRVYGTDGQPVHHSRLELSCTDARFSSGPPFLLSRGNCIEHPARVFLRWNLRASNGRLAANGAYIARISSRLQYDRQVIHTITPSMAEGNSVWGILRSDHGTP